VADWTFNAGVSGVVVNDDGQGMTTIRGTCGTGGVATEACKGCWAGASGAGEVCTGQVHSGTGGLVDCGSGGLGCTTITTSTSILYAPENVSYKVEKGTECKCDMPMCKPDDTCPNKIAVGTQADKCNSQSGKLCTIDNADCTGHVVDGQPQCVEVEDNSHNSDASSARIMAGLTLPLLLLYTL